MRGGEKWFILRENMKIFVLRTAFSKVGLYLVTHERNCQDTSLLCGKHFKLSELPPIKYDFF